MGLLWRDEFPNLPNNRWLALSRFFSLEKKFKNNPEFYTHSKKTIKEFIERDTQQKFKIKIAQTTLSVTYPTTEW